MAPIYDYTCPSCGHQMQVMKRMEDAGSVEFCPDEACRNLWQPMERTYESAPAGIVKGGTPRFHRRRAAGSA